MLASVIDLDERLSALLTCFVRHCTVPGPWWLARAASLSVLKPHSLGSTEPARRPLRLSKGRSGTRWCEWLVCAGWHQAQWDSYAKMGTHISIFRCPVGAGAKRI